MIFFLDYSIVKLSGKKSLPNHSSYRSIVIFACYRFVTVLSFFCEFFRVRVRYFFAGCSTNPALKEMNRDKHYYSCRLADILHPDNPVS